MLAACRRVWRRGGFARAADREQKIRARDSSALGVSGALDHAKLLADFLERLEREVDLRIGERGAGLDAKTRCAFGNDGIAEAGDEDAFGEQRLAHLDGERGVADDDRHDRALAFERLEAAGLETVAQIARDLVKPRNALRPGV